MPPKTLPGAPIEPAGTRPPIQKAPLSFRPAKPPPRNISSGSGKGAKVVGFFAMFALFAAVVWFLFGGDGKREEVRETPESTATTTVVSKVAVPITPITPEELEPSLYQGWVKLSAGTAAKDVYPEKEYIVADITQKNLSSVDVSKWTLKNTAGESASLGSVTGAKGGEKLVISTGKSPTGASFKINKCSGYLEQFLDFIPEIKKSCRALSSLPSYRTLERECQNFMKTIPSCETNTKEYPEAISGECRFFIGANAGYNGCVASHKNGKDFYLKEWRIFLNRDEELWASTSEAVMLLDAEGKLIANVKYGASEKSQPLQILPH